jgi:hypothetical protein
MNADSDLLNGLDIAEGPREFFQAYVAMALQAELRPKAPNPSQVDQESPVALRAEAFEYAGDMMRQEGEGAHQIFGRVNYSFAKAFAYALQAARMMRQPDVNKAATEQLLQMALDELRRG